MPEKQMQSSEKIEVSKSGIKIPIKLIVVICTVVLGGGAGVYGIDSATASKLDKQVFEFKKTDDSRYEETQKILSDHGKKIESMSNMIQRMSDRQMRSEAREEAHRVTESIKDREKREREFGRLFEKNLDRLMDGRDPCADVNCTN
jgi:TolA-binding protein